MRIRQTFSPYRLPELNMIRRYLRAWSFTRELCRLHNEAQFRVFELLWENDVLRRIIKGGS